MAQAATTDSFFPEGAPHPGAHTKLQCLLGSGRSQRRELCSEAIFPRTGSSGTLTRGSRPGSCYLGQVFHHAHHHWLQRRHLHQRKALLQEVLQFLIPGKTHIAEEAAQNQGGSSHLRVPKPVVSRAAPFSGRMCSHEEVSAADWGFLAGEGAACLTDLSSAFPSEAMADTRSSSLSRSSSKTDWWNSSRGVPCRSKKGKADCREGSSTPFSV